MLAYHSPVTADEEVFSAGRSDGHHLIGAAFKHLSYSLHFFMATYANFHVRVAVRCRHKAVHRCKYKVRKKTD